MSSCRSSFPSYLSVFCWKNWKSNSFVFLNGERIAVDSTRENQDYSLCVPFYSWYFLIRIASNAYVLDNESQGSENTGAYSKSVALDMFDESESPSFDVCTCRVGLFCVCENIKKLSTTTPWYEHHSRNLFRNEAFQSRAKKGNTTTHELMPSPLLKMHRFRNQSLLDESRVS